MSAQNNELESRIRAAQVHAAYGNTAAGMSATGVAGALVAGILAGVDAVSTTVAVSFAAILLVQIAAHLALIAAYERRSPPDHEWRDWSRRFSVGALVGGLTLGLGSLWLFAPHRFDLQLLVMLYLCAVASGAIIAFGLLRPAIYFAILPMLVFPIAWMFVQRDWLHIVLALVIAGWLAAIVGRARRNGVQFEESVRLRFENEKSVAEDASSEA